MKLFFIEGKFNNPIPVGGIELDVLMHEHFEMMKAQIESERVLFTGTKKDLSGVIFIMKAENKGEVNEFTELDPLYKKHILHYSVMEFKCQEVSEKFKSWFDK